MNDKNMNINEILEAILKVIHSRVTTRWDLIMVSASMPEKVKEFLDLGFEPVSVTVQKVPKIDQQSKLSLINEYEDVNVIWMKKPENLIFKEK